MVLSIVVVSLSGLSGCAVDMNSPRFQICMQQQTYQNPGVSTEEIVQQCMKIIHDENVRIATNALLFGGIGGVAGALVK